MEVCGLITLTTDFGTKEPYAGVVKGVIYSSNIKARIVDITHEIPPHDIINAAFTLVRAVEHFPEGSVHVAVVDPGVGSDRKSIAVKTDRFYYIGPDNGIFTLVLAHEKNVEIREIVNPPFVLEKISSTFHGRDVFAPCAGCLSAGLSFSHIGPVVRRIMRLTYPKIRQIGDIMEGEIVAVDSFGNLITNVSQSAFRSFLGRRKSEIYFGAERFSKILDRYSQVPEGTPLILFGSSGFLEISMNGGSASSYFMTGTGSQVTIKRV
ncbi:S-adenosyl-l-methionine hydroxide adenosyltransferase family protein [Candidatus Latescibacterota bacterium]